MTVIQARTASTRLPNKVLLPICGEQVLDIVISKCKRILGTDELVVATSDSAKDLPIVDHVKAINTEVFTGSESDVLDRFYRAAIRYEAEALVRVTADCPMLDPAVSSAVVGKFIEGGFDYVSNIKPPTFPDGLDTEVVSMDALERAHREASRTSEREHVMPYIWQNPDKFRLANIESHEDLSHLRWTLDNSDDLEMMRALCKRLEVSFSDASLSDLLEVWKAYPELAQMSSDRQRNESLEVQLRSEG